MSRRLHLTWRAAPRGARRGHGVGHFPGASGAGVSACLFSACFFAACSGAAGGPDGGAAGSAIGQAGLGGGASLGGGGMGGSGLGGSGLGGSGLAGSGLAGSGGLDAGGPPLEPPVEDDPLAVLPGCPEIHVDPFPGQVWAIAAINTVHAEAIFMNVSGREQTLTTDHQWCSFPRYERLINFDPTDQTNRQETVFAPGEILRIPLTEGDLVTPIIFDPAGGELAVYPAPGTYREADRIMAFVSWGEGNPTVGRESVAAEAGIWPLGDRVEFGRRGYTALVAIGASDRASGFMAVPEPCLPGGRPPGEAETE